MHVWARFSEYLVSWAWAEWLKPVNERENFAWSKQAWNGPLDRQQAKPGLDLGTWSRRCSYALLCSSQSAHTSSWLGWCSGLQELHRLNTSHRRLTSGGNLGGAEHAVENNRGGGIFFLLGGVKSLIYGFHSGPSLQIIPLSKQLNSWMLILQIKLTLAAFVQWGIHQGLPPPQHVSPLSNARPSLLNSWKASSALKRPEVSDYNQGACLPSALAQLEESCSGPQKKALKKNGPNRRRSPNEGFREL